ncbi:polymeric immunoglobulin receptor-like isoform X1 [Silurus meridionalis]|nr:polymeric immunoglobulin receptor-like isoform X1 [Silurus meridionalis]
MNFIAVAVILFGAVPSVMPGGVRVKAPLGGNATIHCSYDPGSEKYPKYFSKGQQKTELVRQDRKVTWSRDWRFSLEDDTETRVFTVTMRNLSVDDAGVYWCGVDRWISDIQTEVNLDVVQHVVDDVTTQNDTEIWQSTTEPQDQQSTITEKTQHLSLPLAVLLLLCGIMSAVFFIMKNSKAQAASTAPGNATEPDGDGSSAITETPEGVYATVLHCKPAANQDCARESAPQHPEAVVYSLIMQPPQLPVYSSLSPSEPEQKSQLLSDTSAFSEESHDVYSTVQSH